MLRCLIGAAAIGCAFALAGCQTAATTTTTSPSIGSNVGATIGTIVAERVPQATVAKVQSTAVKVCGFEPTAATVARILGTVSGYSVFVDPAVDVADRICAAVTAKIAVTEKVALGDGGTVFSPTYTALKRRKPKVDAPKGEVNGVPVKGRFVLPPGR